jgi:AcrR family transcriptional regulator
MPSRGIDASGGGADGDRERARRLQRGMLVASGELGYSRVTVGEVVTRAETTTEEFERRFSGLQECFGRAYEMEAKILCDRILRAGAGQATWREGFRAALLELARYAEDNPILAKALLLEVHLAGGEAIVHRTEIFERLSYALDSARRETGSRHSPPPLTALFLVGAIEAIFVSHLARQKPGEILRVIPELERLVADFYFGR